MDWRDPTFWQVSSRYVHPYMEGAADWPVIAAGAANARRFYDSQVGRTAEVLAEGEGRGHTEHFVPVRIAAAPGALLRARITGADADGVLAEAA